MTATATGKDNDYNKNRDECNEIKITVINFFYKGF